MTYEVETHGAKAASLAWLKETVKNTGFDDMYEVPKFKAYAITPPNHEGMIELKAEYAGSWIASNFKNGTKFAVRSGSSTSLPGLMDTQLNLSREEVPEAVLEVYKSFGKPGVKEALSQMPEDERPEGTAVIIQKMVDKRNHTNCYGKKQPVVFGVVFTVTGDGFPDPTFRYAENPGDIVANGNETGVASCHWGLISIARRWYEDFGHPPEFEIAVVGDLSSPQKIYLLQARNQKLTNVEEAALNGIQLVPPEDEQPFLEFEGGGLAKIENMNEVEYLPDSDPERALRAVRNGAKLVLWRQGSPFSHAAVLCRADGAAYGRAPFDKMMSMPLPPFTYFDGKVYFPCVDLVEKPFEKEKTAAEHTNWDIIEWMFSRGYKAPMTWDSMNGEFVKSLTAYKSFLYGKSGPKCLLEFAQMLVMVGTITCAGEMRHERHKRGLAGRYTYDDSREDVWRGMLEGEFQSPIEWVRRWSKDFERLSFKHGYGRTPWAMIARNAVRLAEALEAFRESPSRVAFKEIDRTVSIMEMQEHNNSVYWRKLNAAAMAWPILNKFKETGSWESFEDYVKYNFHGEYAQKAIDGLEGKSIETRDIVQTPIVWVEPDGRVNSWKMEPMLQTEFQQMMIDKQLAADKAAYEQAKAYEKAQKEAEIEKLSEIDKKLMDDTPERVDVPLIVMGYTADPSFWDSKPRETMDVVGKTKKVTLPF